MKRFAIEKLIEWKKSPRRKPLLLLGARQVGKTWLMDEFGKTCFKNTAYIRFDKNPLMRTVFERDYNITRIILAIQVQSGFPIDPEETLIVLDEIQSCPAALTSLKYFCEDAREYHVIAAGSLLGVGDQYGTGFPVGKVDRMYLYPMTFCEFLNAVDNGQMLNLIKSRDWQMLKDFEDKFADFLRYYFFIGGMPEVVDTFIATKDFFQVRNVQKTLLADFRDDFGKHAPPDLKSMIEKIWDSIPAQLAKENKKFIYGDVHKGFGARELEPALRWLLDAGLITQVRRVSKPAMPLDSYADGAFKVFFLDVGLLAAKANLAATAIIDGNRIFQEFKGALTEQYVQQQLLA
ncbi:MAG: ATP-binding protein, partial [Lentisphaeria bacterium]|nr:ATP-binding protein [Lentisphaeria bacterium]